MAKHPLPTLPSRRDDTPLEYWDAIGAAFEQVSIYDGPQTYLKQSQDWPDVTVWLLAAHWCDAEITNGGQHQLFHNPTGVLAPEGVRGFRLVGASTLADLLAAGVAQFGATYPRGQKRRRAALRTLERPGDRRAEWDPFYDLDESYYAVPRPQRFSALATACVRAQPTQFFRAPSTP